MKIMESKELLVTANKISICYNDFGSSSVPLIFIHGFPFDKNMWNPTMKALEKNGFYLECIRKRGAFKNNVVLDDHVWVKLL